MQMIKKNGMFYKLRMDLYNYSIPPGKSYTPFFNTIMTVILFDYSNKESFRDVMNWHQESLRYSNLPTLHHFIIGIDNGKQEISDDEVEGLLNHIDSSRQHLSFFKMQNEDYSEMKKSFYFFVNSVIDNEFNVETIRECLRSNEVRHFDQIVGEDGRPVSAKETRKNAIDFSSYENNVVIDDNAAHEFNNENDALITRDNYDEEMEREDNASSCHCCTLL